MKIRSYRYMVGDFETTVYDGQQATEVWASACVEFYTEDVKVHHSIEETFEYLVGLKNNVCIYYHNLKFDGSFWIDFLMTKEHLLQATELDSGKVVGFLKEKDMPRNTFKYSISDKGQWYTVVIKTKYGKLIEIRDSLKLLPFSLKRIGESFKTKHRKLEMEYKGVRFPGCAITPEEEEYIKNDVLLIKEALEFMFNEGHKKLTIGSCCLEEFKKTTDEQEYGLLFPNVYDITLDPEKHRFKSVGEWIHRSYKGGWCYLVKGKEQNLYRNGTTADVNSLYPSMMSSESGNVYPVGEPTFWVGDIPRYALNKWVYFFVRIRCRFTIKPGYLPFIQIKGNPLYVGNDCLETSDPWNEKEQRYEKELSLLDGTIVNTKVELTLTQTDYFLFMEHYDVTELEYLDGCYFRAECGLFDRYIEKYKNIKLNSKGAMRELAKLFLNNLYGKMAASTDSSFKVAYLKDDGVVGFYPVLSNDKEPGYIPIGSAITSYARNFTIRAAQKNYHGKDKPGFIYADTDSIHCDLLPEQIQGITVHDKNFCCWKLESCWDIGWFVRQKTYIEHVTHEDCVPIDTPYYNVKCAGMPQKCKDIFVDCVSGKLSSNKYTEDELEFIGSHSFTIEDFKIGIELPGRLMPTRIHGGILLKEDTYRMKPR